MSKKWLLSAALMLSAVSAVQGSGFQIRLHSAPLIGTAYAGNAAIGGEVSAQDDNPANLAYIMETQLAATLTPIWPTIKFRTDAGVATRDAGCSAVIPAGYFAWKPKGSRWTVGVSATTPFGLKTDYPQTSAVSAHNMMSDLVTHRGALNVGVRVNDYLSLGASVHLMYSNAELTKSLGVPVARIKGHGWSAGGSIGAILQFCESTRIGLSYMLPESVTVSGNFRTTPVVAAASSTAKATIKYPDYVTLSLYHDFNQQWAAVASVIYTRWSRFKELRVRFPGTANPDNAVDYNWKDSYFWSLGAIYRPTDQWTVRAGVGYDKTPVRSAALRTPAVPDNNRIWLSCGAEYKFTKSISAGVSYTHEIIQKGRLEKTIPVVSGSVRQHVDFVALQLKYVF